MNEISICVLMATYNGEKYLREQIDSILYQTYGNIKILISDDGSQDSTKYILMEYKKKFPYQIEIINGPGKGLELNFFNLIEKSHGFDLYAFSDQDDIWEESKLSRVIEYNRNYPVNQPFVYCSDTILIDQNSKILKQKNKKLTAYTKLEHVLGHNVATGNTIVFNESMRVLFPVELKYIDPLGHDWLTFIYALMFHGQIFYDEFPSVFYRIHNSNNSGIKFNNLGRLKLLWNWILDGKLKRTNHQIIESIKLASNHVSPQVKSVIDNFELMHTAGIYTRVHAYLKSDINRRNKQTNWINFVAVILGKF